MKIKEAAFLLFLLTFMLPACREPGSTPIRGLTTDSAMVVSAHPLASAAGIAILKKGGHAVDAAIAVQFALAVVYPAAGNIGGGGFMVYRQHDGQAFTLDFREKAPLLATRDMYLDADGVVNGQASRRGHLASGTPGTVDGMVRAWKKFGTLEWPELVQPAIDLAAVGFPLTEKEAHRLNEALDLILATSTVRPDFLLKESPHHRKTADIQEADSLDSSVSQNQSGGNTIRHQTEPDDDSIPVEDWAAGDTIRFPDLAATLERIRDAGRAGFYEGKTAELLVAEMERGGGLITREDLERYRSVWRKPVTGTYRDYRIISMGPPSSGGIALIQLLKMVEPFAPDRMDPDSVEFVHLLTEAEKRAFADRATHLGDADHYPVPVDTLISDAYITERMQDYDPYAATPPDEIHAGQIIAEESAETTHFSIVDAQGNAVAVTTTLNGGFGSRVVVGGAGFFLNNEMDDFSITPGHPNMFGLIGGEANAIAPGKRMLSSMTPTILEKQDRLFMVVGSPGGSRIITSVFQTILHVTDIGMPMQEAVNKGRFHHQWRPDKLYYEEGRFSRPLIRELKDMGHLPEAVSSMGRVDAILIRGDRLLEAGADPRGDDTAMGY